MANTKSALKAQRQSEKRAARNRAIKSAVKTYFKKASVAVTAAAEDAEATVRQAVSALDRAARKGIIHKNKAARHKSQLMTRLNRPEGEAVPAAKKAVASARRTTRGRATTPGGTRAAASRTRAANPAASTPARTRKAG